MVISRSKQRKVLLMNEIIKQIPANYQKDVSKAVEILRESGCSEIYLFGSLVSGKTRSRSDIDLAIRGCKPEKYYKLLGQLMMELEHPVDLINLDREDDVTKHLTKEGDLVSVH